MGDNSATICDCHFFCTPFIFKILKTFSCVSSHAVQRICADHRFLPTSETEAAPVRPVIWLNYFCIQGLLIFTRTFAHHSYPQSWKMTCVFCITQWLMQRERITHHKRLLRNTRVCDRTRQGRSETRKCVVSSDALFEWSNVPHCLEDRISRRLDKGTTHFRLQTVLARDTFERVRSFSLNCLTYARLLIVQTRSHRRNFAYFVLFCSI